MGPLALADLIGIDVCLMIMEYFCNETADSKYRPALAFRQKVRAGQLGRMNGKGFFEYR
jgi:3-hydroxybutyryl-CoA dehydrogenase